MTTLVFSKVRARGGEREGGREGEREGDREVWWCREFFRGKFSEYVPRFKARDIILRHGLIVHMRWLVGDLAAFKAF